ncbi:MAG: carboxypeptidase regulatory-like domain-containing protein, partial [Microbacteriaceae bacterium]|nr:carboxypeptidase regulatory-like domain-containing protein [Microbacteriaceae bacterium]
MNAWKFTKARLSAVLVTAITAGLLGPVAVVSPAAAEEVASSPAGTPNPSVAQMTGVSISGTLSYLDEATGLPVPITVGDGFIDLYNSEGWYEVANPDAEGFYSFSDLPAGTYYLKASYSGQDVESMPAEWYTDKPSRGVATAVTVASTVAADRDIMLAPGGQISGTLDTLVDDVVVPVATATVCALSVSPTPTLVEGEDYWCATSGEDGN